MTKKKKKKKRETAKYNTVKLDEARPDMAAPKYGDFAREKLWIEVTEREQWMGEIIYGV